MHLSMERTSVRTLLLLLILSAQAVFAQAGSGTTPADPKKVDYYQAAYRLTGTPLRLALHNIVKGHTVVSYDGLYTAFPTTDAKPNNIVWDMYSDRPGGTPAYTFTHGVKKCGNYSGEGDCYNREHSWPDSWLGATNPARSDLFHMYPTDGYVNNRRSNDPYGVVGTASWTSTNGSKSGSNVFPGYTGTVFEPINEYKGDLARGLMYMSVRYYLEDSGFSTSPATNKSDILPWYANLLYSWHMRDTVSTKEINRNNAIFTFQNNRNPFIDHPEFAAEIWQTSMAPSVVSIAMNSSSSVIVDFNRYVDSVSATAPGNYTWDARLGTPTSYEYGVNNDISKVKVNFSSVVSTNTYTLGIRGIKSINNLSMSDTSVSFSSNGTTDISGLPAAPRQFTLLPNYPNPFNPSTVVSFTLPQGQFIELSVFDVLGNKVAEIYKGYKEEGTYSESFDASRLTAGAYFIKLSAGKFTQVQKAMLVK